MPSAVFVPIARHIRDGDIQANLFQVFQSGTYGSEQESDKRPISRSFPENHEFSFGDSHTLSLEQQVA